jgi:hypothetical protein
MKNDMSTDEVTLTRDYAFTSRGNGYHFFVKSCWRYQEYGAAYREPVLILERMKGQNIRGLDFAQVCSPM